MIKFETVTKTFPDGTYALTDIDFEIPDQQFLFIIGPSGAGKSTLLRLLLREILPSKGEIYFDDLRLSGIQPKGIPQFRRKIGIIFQDYRLLSDRNVFENVALSLQIASDNEKEISKKVNDVLEMVGILDKKLQFPQQLSGGELQRTSIARAIVADPKYLLADEPTADLDPDNAWEIVKLLSEINKSGTTVIMATHNAEIVNTLKKRVIFIENGKIVKDSKKGKYENT
jgi:cell division transport system ATP-binding protein